MNPLSATKLVLFLKREKDAECCETEKYVFCLKKKNGIYLFVPVLRFFDFSGSFEKHVEKWQKK